MRPSKAKTAAIRTSFVALLAPSDTRRRIRRAARVVDWWLNLPLAERVGPAWTRQRENNDVYQAWLLARRATYVAVSRDWFTRRALEGLLEVMLPSWRPQFGFADPILAPNKLAPYEWVLDAILAELTDPKTLSDELGGRLEVEDVLELLRGTWLSISGAGEETE